MNNITAKKKYTQRDYDKQHKTKMTKECCKKNIIMTINALLMCHILINVHH